MPTQVLVATILGFTLAIAGFLMAFKPSHFRRGPHLSAHSAPREAGGAPGPLGYALRIAGVMIMMFGIVLAGMFMLVYGL